MYLKGVKAPTMLSWYKYRHGRIDLIKDNFCQHEQANNGPVNTRMDDRLDRPIIDSVSISLRFHASSQSCSAFHFQVGAVSGRLSNFCTSVDIFSRQASLARQAFLITPLDYS